MLALGMSHLAPLMQQQDARREDIHQSPIVIFSILQNKLVSPLVAGIVVAARMNL
jgi:hypothetical protein